jgi:hypothetical protein
MNLMHLPTIATNLFRDLLLISRLRKRSNDFSRSGTKVATTNPFREVKS